ncbi:MAG: class I SAM-dependent methyltransferase [Bacteroidetes bacterium]|nr:class I SAM-dependent methyltransferase [Bacteroidota bacterium]
MYNSFQLASKYLCYYLKAFNGKGHGMHSPFIFDFMSRVLNDKQLYPAYEKVEELRHRLLRNKEKIEVEDFGAGSSIDKSDRRTISSITKNAAKPEKYGQLLYRMIKYYRPETILELGTSLGITTSYLALANQEAEVTTMEGSPSVVSIAKKNFTSLGAKNVNIVEGDFDSTLSGVMSKFSSIGFAFLDGNHREEPTVRYFKQVAGKISNDSIVVLDDIHWSAGMEAAWQTIKNHSSVKCSVDLFFIGIVFFREEFHEKQHFSIRF